MAVDIETPQDLHLKNLATVINYGSKFQLKPAHSEQINRNMEIADIYKQWESPSRKVACIEGNFDLDLRSVSVRLFKQSRIWNFRSGLTVEDFFDELIFWLTDGIQDKPETLPIVGKKHLAELHLKASYLPSLIVLQGFEALQYGGDDPDNYGLIKNEFLRDWLRFFALGEHNHFCVISGDFPVFDLMDFTTVEYFK